MKAVLPLLLAAVLAASGCATMGYVGESNAPQNAAPNEHGLRPSALVFDTLTFSLATGDPEFANSAVETIEGIGPRRASLEVQIRSLGKREFSMSGRTSDSQASVGNTDRSLPVKLRGIGVAASDRASRPS